MKKAKRELKYTLSGQMTAIFVGLLVFVLMLVFIVNTGFLGRYYMSHKQKDLIEMYEGTRQGGNIKVSINTLPSLPRLPCSCVSFGDSKPMLCRLSRL